MMNLFGAAFTDLTVIASSARTGRHAQLLAQQSSLQNAAVYQNYLQGLAQYRTIPAGVFSNEILYPLIEIDCEPCHKQTPPSNVTPLTPKGHRTPEEIQAQLEARYAEMEAEAERKAKAALTACSVCRWANGAWCRNPLVIGIEQKLTLNTDRYAGDASLCGPEKALWELPEPKRNLWQRFIDWFLEPWRDNLAQTNGKG